MNSLKEFDVLIVGGGVTGTALFYTLSEFTNIKRIVLLEKYSRAAQVNSKQSHNSQTLHFGDIETNYKLEKAKLVKVGADMVRRYIEKHPSTLKGKKVYTQYHKMVLL